MQRYKKSLENEQENTIIFRYIFAEFSALKTLLHYEKFAPSLGSKNFLTG